MAFFDLSSFQHKKHSICRISKVIDNLDHSFLSYAVNISVQNALIDYMTLTFDLSVTILFLYHISRADPGFKIQTPPQGGGV